MDAKHFDTFVRAMGVAVPRRAALSSALGAGLAVLMTHLGIADAQGKKKRRKKKKCKNGATRCGGACCAPGSCIGGACCPAARTCGSLCCDADRVCGDPDTETCVVEQGTCPTGADTCASASLIVCNNSNTCVCAQATDGKTRCATPIGSQGVDDCGDCTTDADCELKFPNIAGVFCGENATGPCGCQPGQNLCAAPCPV